MPASRRPASPAASSLALADRMPVTQVRTPPGATLGRRRPRTLALELVESLGDRIREGRYVAGDKLPTEAAIMAEFDVSRTVVREAISKLQASGLVETRHGIGTFVIGLGEAPPFRITADDLATLQDVIAMLELRIGLETEAAALAAMRRDDGHLARLRSAIDAFADAIEQGRDTIGIDFQFHLEVARATQNARFVDFMASLGTMIIPRSRLAEPGGAAPTAQTGQPATLIAATTTDEHRRYLRRVNAEHESILDAIAAQDAEAARAAMRTHLANSRERRRRVAISQR